MKLENIWQVAFAIITAIVSAYAGYWFANQPERMSYIEYAEYRSYSDESLRSLFGRASDVKIFHKGIELANVSSKSFFIANTSNKNIEKIRIYFEIKDKSRPAIGTDYSVPDGYSSDIVKAIPSPPGIYAYELDYINRTTEVFDGFDFTLYFASAKPPDVEVKVAAKGVDVRKYASKKQTTSETIWRSFSRIWWLYVIYFSVAFLFIQYFNAAKQIRRQVVKDHVRSLLSDSLSEIERTDRAETYTKIMLESPSFIAIVKKLFTKNKS